jgi:hypothetical protein
MCGCLADGFLFLQQARQLALDSTKSTDSTKPPSVKRLSRSAPLSFFIETLEQNGCVIIKDFTDPATLKQADEEIQPWLEKQEIGAVVGGTWLPFTMISTRF